MQGYSAILFDKDGTIFDFQATWGPFTHGFILDLARGTERAGPLAEVMGYDLEAQLFLPHSLVVAGSVDEWVEAIHPLLPEWQRGDLVDHIKDQTAVARQVPAAPLEPLLSGLRANGYRLGIATNDGEAPVTRQLTDNGVHHHFDFVAGYDSGWGGKPGPGMLLAFAAHVGTDPADIVMVGDSTHDLEAARAAGMARVAVLTGTASEADLAPHADVVLPSIAALPAWLEATKATGRGRNGA